MITVTKTDGNFDVETTLRQPGVYLDQDSLTDIARTDTRRQRFLANFEKKGTLLFTWMPNDGVDFMHAAVAAACADFLVLDQHWKRRVLKIASTRSYQWVYYRAELEAFWKRSIAQKWPPAE